MPKLHLIAPAASCKPLLRGLGLESAGELIAMIQDAVGASLTVTGHAELIEAGEDELHGGRDDDVHRAADLQAALADDATRAIVTLRGGAWFTRILPLIDFSLLDRRTTPVFVFGFSELTTLVNIVGRYRHAIGIYDMGPAFLMYGLRRRALFEQSGERKDVAAAKAWMREQLRPHVLEFFRDVVNMIEGRGSARVIRAKLVAGRLDQTQSVHFVGGNLTVLTTLLGTRFAECIDPAGKWLVLEDLNEKPERIDRFLAHLKLAGYWDKVGGVLLGDFHRYDIEMVDVVAELITHYLMPNSDTPLLVTADVGHIWPMSPLPLHTDLPLERCEAGFEIRVPRDIGCTGAASLT